MRCEEAFGTTPWQAGSSALRAAYLRRTLEESSAATRDEAAGVFWDLEAYYDTIDLAELIRHLVLLDWPPRQAVIALVVHTAPRTILRTQLQAGKTQQVYTSILAGCQYSKSFARALLHELLERVHAAHPAH